MNTQNYAQSYAEFYKKLDSDMQREDYEAFFDANSYFEDPFQSVTGIAGIYRIFCHMYDTLYEPKFKVDEIICSDGVAYLRWIFEYRLGENKKINSFVGISRVTFNDEGKIKSHIDYWDAAQHVYEQIPLLGAIIRFIKSKIHA